MMEEIVPGQPAHSLIRHSHKPFEFAHRPQLPQQQASRDDNDTPQLQNEAAFVATRHNSQRRLARARLSCSDEDLAYWSAPNASEDRWTSPWTQPGQVEGIKGGFCPRFTADNST
jgi:hypothetical protein